MIIGYLKTMYRRINNIDEEGKLLEEMLTLQKQIRKRREKKRILKTNNSERYKTMFEPVTKSIEKLAPPTAPSLPTIPPIAPIVTLPSLPPPPPPPPMHQNLGDLYAKALNDVPRRKRDDGILGFDTTNHHIGNFNYDVSENTLSLFMNGVLEHEYYIDDINLWKLLLVKNPKSIELDLKDADKKYLDFVEKYKKIAHDLNLTDDVTSSVRKRTKYKIIEDVGRGFMFTLRPPINPTTIVVPSDNQELMRQLYLTLAELRAGNTSMRNIVVPLAAAAKRKGLLPENLLTPDEEMWVFA